MTNTGQGTLSARTHPKNLRMEYFHGPCRFFLTNGAGERKIFALKKKDGVYSAFELIEERHANGNWISYERDKHNELKAIRSYNHLGQCLSIIAFRYGERFVQAEGSDGRFVNYYYAKREILRPRKGKKGVNSYAWTHVLSTAELPGAFRDQYEYEHGHHAHTYFALTHRLFPNQHRLINTYDHNTHRVARQSAPLGPNGEEIEFIQFGYEEHYTDAIDCYGHRTRYLFYPNHRPRSVEQYLHSDQRYSEHISLWGSGSNEGNLLARYLANAHYNVYSYQSFDYDAHGNVLQEHLWGNLTGQCQVPFKTDKSEFPPAKRYRTLHQDLHL